GCEVQRQAPGFCRVTSRVLCTDTRSHQKLIAGRGEQSTRCRPAGTLQVSDEERTVGEFHTDVPYAGDHVGPQFLSPMPLARRSVSERTGSGQLERCLEALVASPVDAGRGEDLESLPVRTDG